MMRLTLRNKIIFLLFVLVACQSTPIVEAPTATELSTAPPSLTSTVVLPTVAERTLSPINPPTNTSLPSIILNPPDSAPTFIRTPIRTLAPFTTTPSATNTPLPTDTPLPTPIAAILGTLNDPNAPAVALNSAPAFNVAMIAVIPPGTFAQVIGRSPDNEWYAVITLDRGSGWVYRTDVYALEDLSTLPVIQPPPYETLVPPTATATPIATLVPTPVLLGDVQGMVNRLRATPILYNFNTQAVRAIFQHGREIGNRAEVFTVIGDSNSTNGDFLVPIGAISQNYCEYGNFSYLVDTVNFFSTPINELGRNSFTHDSITSERGFNTAAAFDPFWATNACVTDEAPLVCEYRTTRSSAVIIMVGGIDITTMNAFTYYQNMVRIVETSMSYGVIPVLTTFVVIPGRNVWQKSLEFNMMLLDIADLYDVPVINLWAAAEPLPDHGIGPDRTHLRAQIGRYCDFDGAQTQLGGTLRNLLTLQALDTLRREVYFAPVIP
jgi:hypothetical protein